MNSTVEANGLTKRYRDVLAVDHISFEVGEGEIFGFLGPNGAGKTSTIRMLTTLASITAGNGKVAGHDLVRDPSAVRRSIGVVPQEITLDNELKGIENLMLSAKLHHVQDNVAKVRAKELLELVELDAASEKMVKMYSGGMKRRLQLVTALIHSPSIVFLDEPTVGLDIQTRTRIWDYLRRLNSEEGLTIFMTTHYLEEADSLCDRIAIMDHGTIKVSGSPADLKSSLHGDILTLEVTDGSDLTNYLEAVGEGAEVSRIGNSYRMKVSKVESVLPVIIKEVSARGLKIKETSFSKPTLDQVFLEVTGRSMRDVEESGSNHTQGVKVVAEAKQK